MHVQCEIGCLSFEHVQSEKENKKKKIKVYVNESTH